MVLLLIEELQGKGALVSIIINLSHSNLFCVPSLFIDWGTVSPPSL